MTKRQFREITAKLEKMKTKNSATACPTTPKNSQVFASNTPQIPLNIDTNSSAFWLYSASSSWSESEQSRWCTWRRRQSPTPVLVDVTQMMAKITRDSWTIINQRMNRATNETLFLSNSQLKIQRNLSSPTQRNRNLKIPPIFQNSNNNHQSIHLQTTNKQKLKHLKKTRSRQKTRNHQKVHIHRI